jgi:hypothetical protein
MTATMDTDDLSRQTYKAVIITAENFHHDLTVQFVLLSYKCKTDDDFLDESAALIQSWLLENDLQHVIQDIYFEDPPSKRSFRRVLQTILNSISTIKEIAIDKREFEAW